jgi:Protein of unknown function (DUF2924)
MPNVPLATITRSPKQRDFDCPELEAFLASLPELSLDNLRRAWSERLKTPPPALRSVGLLRQLLAWQLQEREFGGLDNSTERILAKAAGTIESSGPYEPRPALQLSPGVEITREWKGVMHKVVVNDEGFLYLDKQYGSLSEVARFITGTRWSGPRFFGLEQKPSRKPDRVDG